MINIAICDDDIFQLEFTYRMVMEFVSQKPELDFTVRPFQSADDLLECVEQRERFHIYLLDIIMPEMDGIVMGERIRALDENAVIMYLTASPDFAVKSYRVFAYQYLIKPIRKDDLFCIMQKVLDKLAMDASKSFPVKTKEGLTAVWCHQIVFIEYAEHSLRFHLSDGTEVVSVTTREPFDNTVKWFLQDPRFVRPHVSFLVNMSFVRAVTDRDFTLLSGARVPITKKNAALMKKTYIDFLL